MNRYNPFFAILSGEPPPTPEKEFATLRACAAIKGIALERLDGDFGHPIYVATCGALTKQFDTIDQVASWFDGRFYDEITRPDECGWLSRQKRF